MVGGIRIAVLGTGANGSCVAADLVTAGYDVQLIDQWPAHVEAMRAGGLKIVQSGTGETTTVPVVANHLCDLRATNPQFDLVFLVVKAYDTRWMSEFIRPFLTPDGIVVPLQNAMTTQDVADIVGPARTVASVVELASDIFVPGTVQRHTPLDRTWFGLGCIDPSAAARVDDVAAVMSRVGKVSILSDIMSGKWMKVVVNAVFLGFFGALGLTIQQAAALPGARDLMLRIGTEALRAGQDLGHKSEPIFGMRPEEMTGSNQFLEKIFDKLIRDVGPNARPAVLQDHLKGRFSEVDLINGLVVTEAERNGWPAPGNAAVVAITRRIFAGEIEPGPQNIELVRAMMSEA